MCVAEKVLNSSIKWIYILDEKYLQSKKVYYHNDKFDCHFQCNFLLRIHFGYLGGILTLVRAFSETQLYYSN